MDDGRYITMEYYSALSYRRHHQVRETLADKDRQDENSDSQFESESDKIISSTKSNLIGCDDEKDSRKPLQAIVDLTMDTPNTPLRKVKDKIIRI